MGLLGVATFCDAFDALAIAFALPAISGRWHLTPRQIGVIIAAGYLGQLAGALSLGAIADRYGRRVTLFWAFGIMSLFSLVSAVAGNLAMLLAARVLQGIGLGAEVPLAAIYLNEISPARSRGRLILLFQSIFAASVAITAIVALWVVPRLGWRWMLAFGAMPLVLLPTMWRNLPESPRWLAGVGQLERADQALQRIEQAIARTRTLPPALRQPESAPAAARGSLASLLKPGYRRRTLTVWAILFCTSAVGYGLLTWLPTLYHTIFHLTIQQSLAYSLSNSLVSPLGSLSGALLIDRLGRKPTFAISFIGAAVPLLVLWQIAGHATPLAIATLAGIACFFISILLAGIYVYAPEVYPTEMRGLGVGVGTGFYRLAAIVSPAAIGVLLQATGVTTVFFTLALIAALGALVVWLFAIETRGQSLEQLTI
jgi:putative MFS transporter